MTAEKGFKRLVRERASRTGESYASARRALLSKRSESPLTIAHDSLAGGDLIEIDLEGVRLGSFGAANCYLDFKEKGGSRHLFVFIGSPEGSAISFALQGSPSLRPMTHDAFKQAVDALGGRLLRVVVGHRPDTSTFTADVTIATADGQHHLDWRVSDAVAMAVRCDPRPAILAPASLLSASAQPSMSGIEWPGRATVRCSCGEVLHIEPDEFKSVAGSPDHLEASVSCSSCEKDQIVRVVRPTQPGAGGAG